MPDHRIALVLDDDETHLGMVSLQLLRLGIDVVYSKDLDEARLLVRQEAGRVGAVVFPPSVDPTAAAELSDRIASTGRPATLLVVGEEPVAARKQALRATGVERALWEPYDESTLRFLVNAAVYDDLVGDPRGEVRIPTTLRGRAYAGLHRKDVLVSSLSGAGAYLETPRPDPEGSVLRLEIDLSDGEDRPLFTRGKVRYALAADDGRGLPTGMGVLFEALPGPDEARLRAFVHERARRFTV